MTELKIEGMSCQHCLRAVQEAVDSVDEARPVVVELGRVRLEGDADAAERVRAAIEEEGYTVAEMTPVA